MRYRILIQFPRDNEPGFSPQECREKAFVGPASIPELADFMEEIGLAGPRKLRNPRAEFYFTELGYTLFGKRLATKARQLGYEMRVKGLRNIGKNNIAYQDKFQMAVLPIDKNSRRKPKRNKERRTRLYDFDLE
jgi:hypothetical protein